MLRRLVTLTLVVLVGVAAGARAQESASSSIVGVVTDSTQAPLPGATITVTQTGTGLQRVVVTDSEGRFSMPGLRPATYDIKVELSGFNNTELKAVVLRTGETIRPTLSLSVGTVQESLTVTASAPLLQTSSAAVGAVINEKMLEDLPVTGRTLLNIATTAPGVTGRSFQQNTQYGRRDQFITVEGGRDSSTNYAIDGVYVRSLRFNNMSLNPPIDTVQEVNVLRNSFSTEYGQGSAVVSMVTKSGTNAFRGTVSEYFRNDALDSKNYFAPTKPTHERNQFGAATGGPVMRNKLFFFGGYEGTRETNGEVQIATAITDQRWLQGDFSGSATIVRDPLTGQPFPGNIIPQAALLAVCQIADPEHADREPAGRDQQLPGDPRLHRQHRHDDAADGREPDCEPDHVRCVSSPTTASRFCRRPLRSARARRRARTWRPAIPGSSRRMSSTKPALATTTAFHNQYNYLPGQEDYTAENYAAAGGPEEHSGRRARGISRLSGRSDSGCLPALQGRASSRAHRRTSSVSRTPPAR